MARSKKEKILEKGVLLNFEDDGRITLTSENEEELECEELIEGLRN